MSDALRDARDEFSRIYGTDPDETFETLLARVWHDGHDQGMRDRTDEIIDFLKETR